MKEVNFIIQAVVPDYRIGFFNALNKLEPFKLVSGDFYFTETVISSPQAKNILNRVESKNKFIFKRKALLQVWSGMFWDLFSKQVRVVELNPRCFVSWFSLFFSFFMRRGKTVVWGHRLNRKGDESILNLRTLMLGLANGVIFYTEEQKDSFAKTVVGKYTPSGFAPNSVLSESQICNMPKAGTDFIYVGRLVDEKKPLLLIEAFIMAKASKGLGCDSTLHIVGDGPCFKKAEWLIKEHDASDFIVLHGHQSDYEYLKALYSRCIASVSPGYVGLSITQSFSFGKPMIISKDEPHSPELECFSDSENGTFFETDSIEMLAEELINYSNDRNSWSKQSAFISNEIKKNYTYEAMAKGFYSLIKEVQNGK
ncbi:MAG: glycosyltransferase [Colwellia sp.]